MDSLPSRERITAKRGRTVLQKQSIRGQQCAICSSAVEKKSRARKAQSRKGLDFFWEQSVTGPTAGAPKVLPGSRPAGSIACAGLRW